MRQMVSVSFVLTLVLCCLSATASADDRKPLSNDSVVQMVKAGLEERTVIKAIENNATAFDVSAPALIALKDASVSDKIVSAMLDAAAKNNQPAKAAVATTSDPVPGLPKDPGVYFKQGNAWTQLQDAPTPKSKSKGGFMASASAFGKMRILQV